MKIYTKKEWEREQYKGQWSDCPYNRDEVASGKLPAYYINRRYVMVGGDCGPMLITEGVHFLVEGDYSHLPTLHKSNALVGAMYRNGDGCFKLNRLYRITEEYAREHELTCLERVDTTAVKKSETIKQQMEALEAEYEHRIQSEVYDNPERTAENHDELWMNFYRSYGAANRDRQRELEDEYRRELNREIEVGDGVTMYLWSDAHACTVIAKTAKTITIQRDKAIRDPIFTPEWVPGGFSAICTNSDEQSWTYERNPDGEIIRCRWSEKNGRYQTGSDGSIKIGIGRHEHYDYNF